MYNNEDLEDPESPIIFYEHITYNNPTDSIIPDEINNIYLLYFSNLLPILNTKHTNYIIEKWNIFKEKNPYCTHKDKAIFFASLMNILKNM